MSGLISARRADTLLYLPKRKQAKDQILSAADSFLQELGVNLAERKIVEVAFVDAQVKKLLSL